MAKRTPSKFQERLSGSLTLHWRLTLWTAGLLLFLGLGLTLFTNVIAAMRVPQVLIAPMQLPSQGEIIPDPSVQNHEPDNEVYTTSIGKLQQIIIQEIRLITLSGILLFSIIGAIGAYKISRIAIQPLHHLNLLMAEIKPKSLGQRLNLKRPEDEIKQLADSFDDMLDRLERAFEQQGRFVADAAHELRTPLANMRANLEVIQGDSTATEEDYRNLSQTFDRSLERLESLVEDLLLLAKAEKPNREEPASIEDLLKMVIEETEGLSEKNQVDVTLASKGNHILSIDKPLLSVAFRNLILNGIQYNSPGGKVTISVRLDAKTLVVSFTDTGIGIPERDLPHIFERFYRVDKSRALHLGGSGLGLSIAAHIVELHGGTIEAESKIGAGSRFVIFLPKQEVCSLS